MDCPSCGAANPEGRKFCGDCGTPLPLAPRARPKIRPVRSSRYSMTWRELLIRVVRMTAPPVDSRIRWLGNEGSVQGRHRPPAICVAATYQPGCQILSARRGRYLATTCTGLHYAHALRPKYFPHLHSNLFPVVEKGGEP